MNVTFGLLIFALFDRKTSRDDHVDAPCCSDPSSFQRLDSGRWAFLGSRRNEINCNQPRQG